MAGMVLLMLSSMSVIGAPRFEVSLDRNTIRLGEVAVATLKFIDGTPAGNIDLPKVNSLRMRQLSGVSQQVSIINGKRTSTYSLRLEVRPSALGVFSIPSMAIQMGGQVVRSQPVRLTVQKALPGSPMRKVAQQGYLAEFVIPKSNVYVGEPFVFYIRLTFTDVQAQAPEMKNEGFTFSDGKLEQTSTVFEGRSYNVALFPKVTLPLKFGRLKLGPVEMPINVAVGRDFFGRSRYRSASTTIPAAEINVLPLPTTGRPASFSGAVGSFTMDVKASPTNLTAGDPITLNIDIAGAGALENIQLPSFDAWEDFKVYPPNSSVNYQNKLTSAGNRVFEQVVVPQKADVPFIPEIEFSFFDPKRRAYQTLKNPPIPLTVTPAAKMTAAPVIMVAQTNQTDTGPKLATELVHIKQHLGALQAVEGTGGSVWALPSVTFLAWIVLLFRRRNIERLENDPRLRRRLETDRLIEGELDGLKKHASAGDGPEFFKLLVRLLQERLGEKLDLPASAITESVVDEKLKPAGVKEELVSRLERLFDTCNQARYAPDMGKAELQKLASDAEIVLGDLKEVEL